MAPNPQDFDQAILDVANLQADINYQQAQDSLRSLIRNWDLTASEQQGLETELETLVAMLEKLEQTVVKIAAFGLVGRGKSSVLNALLGEEVFAAGPLHGVTQTVAQAPWTLETTLINPSDRQKGTVQTLGLPGWRGSRIELIDTPGLDEIAGESREALAKTIAQQCDLVLFIVSGDLTKIEFGALSFLREVGKPMVLVFNKVDQYPEADRLAIYHQICDRRVKELLSPDEIVMVAAAPLVTQVVKDETGAVVRWEKCRGQPEITPLKLKILEILGREGKALLALNSLLFADRLGTAVAQRKVTLREEAANHLIQRAITTKAMAIAINPVTVLDLFSGAVIDVALIMALSHLYGLSLNHRQGVALLKTLALGMGGVSASEAIAQVGLGSLKSLLGLGAGLTGGLTIGPYLSVAIAQGGVAGVATHVIGQATKTYLANGGSWGDDSPTVVVRNILDNLDEKSILHRIKQELRSRLRSPSP